jgi:hypothetical protein
MQERLLVESYSTTTTGSSEKSDARYDEYVPINYHHLAAGPLTDIATGIPISQCLSMWTQSFPSLNLIEPKLGIGSTTRLQDLQFGNLLQNSAYSDRLSKDPCS